jgi:hypothetical protein
MSRSRSGIGCRASVSTLTSKFQDPCLLSRSRCFRSLRSYWCSSRCFLRWLRRRIRDDEIHRAFLRDLATNHLSHIYSALRAIATVHGIWLETPPQIQYLELNGPRRRDS